jgi:hypothetical protein
VVPLPEVHPVMSSATPRLEAAVRRNRVDFGIRVDVCFTCIFVHSAALANLTGPGWFMVDLAAKADHAYTEMVQGVTATLP